MTAFSPSANAWSYIPNSLDSKAMIAFISRKTHASMTKICLRDSSKRDSGVPMVQQNSWVGLQRERCLCVQVAVLAGRHVYKASLHL